MVEYNFLIPVKTIDEVLYFSNIKLHDSWRIFTVGDYCWSLQTFLVLRDFGLPVYLSHRFDKNRINIGGGRTLEKLFKRTDYFVVDIKADVPKDYWGRNIQIVQNKIGENIKKKKYYISHWPQAGLIQRNSGRKIVKNVAYAGRINNLFSGKRNLNDLVKNLDMEFKVLDQSNWNDYSTVDICIGIRSFDNKPYIHKPATKMYNAWHAQVPFIGGPESSFERVGIPDKNYIRVCNEDELIHALKKLKNNSEFYNFLIDNGNKAKCKYDCETIAKEWIHFLENVATPEYHQWKGQSNFTRMRHLGSNIEMAIFKSILRFPTSLPNVISNSIKRKF